MVSDDARLTVLRPDVADLHEHAPDPGCLLAPDGDTCCPNRATHRVELTPLPGYETGPVTFVCADHEPHMRTHPATVAIREVHRAP
jgi:hypothetical protein